MVGAHHEQPFENAFARAGVQRGNHQMPGQSGPHRQLRRGFITNLADDERLRILPQQMPRGAGKIKADSLVHLGLHRAGNHLLHRVLHGDDLASAQFGQIAEAGVNGGGLAAARRAGQQQQSGGLTEKMFQLGVGVRGQGQFPQRFCRGRIEKAEDNFLAGHGRIGGHADVVAAPEFIV